MAKRKTTNAILSELRQINSKLSGIWEHLKDVLPRQPVLQPVYYDTEEDEEPRPRKKRALALPPKELVPQTSKSSLTVIPADPTDDSDDPDSFVIPFYLSQQRLSLPKPAVDADEDMKEPQVNDDEEIKTSQNLSVNTLHARERAKLIRMMIESPDTMHLITKTLQGGTPIFFNEETKNAFWVRACFKEMKSATPERYMTDIYFYSMLTKFQYLAFNYKRIIAIDLVFDGNIEENEQMANITAARINVFSQFDDIKNRFTLFKCHTSTKEIFTPHEDDAIQALANAELDRIAAV